MGKGLAGGRESVSAQPEPRVCYFHLVRGAKPTREDFLSHQARGIPPRRADAARADLNRGVSLLDTLERASHLRGLFPRLGWHAAKLEIPAGVRVEATLWEGHYTVWADPDDLLGWVVEVVPLP